MNKLLLVLLFSGCASDSGDSQFIDGFSPPAPKSGEIQIVAPAVYDMAPGADITMCSYIDQRIADETDIVDYQTFQSLAGAHHALLYSVMQQQPANTHECNEDDMINARYLAGGGADSPPADLPEGVVFRMPANTQLLIQTHWINATDHPIDGQAAFNLQVTKPKPEHRTAQLFATTNTEFVLPVGTGRASADCTIAKEMNVFTLTGHMHEWGTHVKITHTPVASATEATIYETGWSNEYQFNPPRNHYTTDAPFVLSPGDRIHIDCDYNNTTGTPLPFPSEMCAAVAYGYPLDTQINCVDGIWQE
jgi:hypothetical protein